MNILKFLQKMLNLAYKPLIKIIYIPKENIMKMIKAIILSLIALLFTACPKEEPVTEPSYTYTVEINITNNSSSQKTLNVQAYTLYDEDNFAQKLYDCDSLTVEANKTASYSEKIENTLCDLPHLSHVLQIDEKNFAGFDTETLKIKKDDAETTESIVAESSNLGSVKWNSNSEALLTYKIEGEDKTFTVKENVNDIKIIYAVTIDVNDNISISISGVKC